jgi:hypothetical protein
MRLLLLAPIPGLLPVGIFLLLALLIAFGIFALFPLTHFVPSRGCATPLHS